MFKIQFLTACVNDIKYGESVLETTLQTDLSLHTIIFNISFTLTFEGSYTCVFIKHKNRTNNGWYDIDFNGLL